LFRVGVLLFPLAATNEMLWGDFFGEAGGSLDAAAPSEARSLLVLDGVGCEFLESDSGT
uniref:Alpha/beta hydrolase n=1 Tax=Haemonchus placei TaxID=6290 RepID=A0A0N4X7T7_HAEPC